MALVERSPAVADRHCQPTYTVTANRSCDGHFGGTYGTNSGHGFGGGIYTGVFGNTGIVMLANSVVFGNFGTTMGSNEIISSNHYGHVSSLGHNLIGTAVIFSNFVASNLIGVDPLLGPLQDNGGLTPIHALLATSPAIDAGAASLLPFDQRGQPRSVDNPAISNWMGSEGTDIGALEVNHLVTLTGISKVGTNVEIKFTSVSDKCYRIQYKADAVVPTWGTLPEVMRAGILLNLDDVQAGDIAGGTSEGAAREAEGQRAGGI